MKNKRKIRTLTELTVAYEKKIRIGKILHISGFFMLALVAVAGCADIFMDHTVGSRIFFGATVLITCLCFAISGKLKSGPQPIETFARQRFFKEFKKKKKTRQFQDN